MKITLKRVYNILLCFAIFLLGACLIVGCLDIYYTAEGRDQVYSREIVAKEFSKFLLPIGISLFVIIFSFVIDFFDPMPEPLSKSVSYDFLRNAVLRRRDLPRAQEDIALQIKGEMKYRRMHSLITLLLSVIASAVFLFYALNPAHYHKSEINDSMIKAMLWLLPCLIVPFVYSIIAAILKEKSLKREIELIKKLPPKTAEDSKATNEIPFFCIKVVILIIAVGFTVYGCLSGGTADVLTKAVNICTECIGLG